MPDQIERTIYKLDMDDSGYIQGVERTVASTTRLTQAQEEANKRLQTNQAALRSTSEAYVKAKLELDNYTGSNQKYRQQLERDVSSLEKKQQNLIKLVDESRRAYDNATRAAQGFVTAASRQPATVPGLPSPLPPPISTIPSIQNLPTPQISEQLRTLLTQLREIKGEDISNVFDLAAGEMDAFRFAIEAAEEALESMVGTEKEFSEEFKNLSLVVSEGNKIIEEFDKATAEASRSALGYRQQITNLHKELGILEQAGKTETAQYVEKQKELVKLKRAYTDQQQTIRILASETRALDFGRAAITTAISAFQTWTSVAILAGGASEDLQKKTFQLFAAMQLITSLEQLNNQLKRVSVLRLNALSAAQSVYTAAVGASTGALRAFRIALLATGVGAVLAGIGFLVLKLHELNEEQEEANRQAELFKEVNDEAAKSVAAEAAKLIVFKEKLNDANIPVKERLRIAKEYNKTADEQNKIDTKQINNLQLINEKIAAQNKLILERATALAATNILTEKVGVLLEKQLEVDRLSQKAGVPAEQLIIEQTTFESKLLALRQESISKNRTRTFKEIGDEQEKIQKEQAEFFKGLTEKEIRFLTNTVEERNKAKQAVDETLKLLGPLIKAPTTVFKGEVEKATNEFEKEYRRLINRIAQLGAEALSGADKIRAEFRIKFETEQQRIADLFKDKKVTSTQAKLLIDIAARINQEELDRALEEFGEQVVEKQNQLNELLESLRSQNNKNEIDLIQERFRQRAELIDFNEKQEIAAAKRATEERLQQLALLNRGGFIEDEKQFQDAKNKIVEEGQQAETNIILKAAQERRQLAVDSFAEILDRFDNILSDSKLVADRAALADIRQLVATFQTGKISYEQYKKDLAAIQKKYEDAQLQRTIDTLEEEIRSLKRKRDNIIDITVEQYDTLTKIIKQKEQDLINAQTKQTTTQGDDTKPPKQIDTINDYVAAVSQLTESIISFWQKANEAEAAALDRSIAIQERRVNEARRIAERGNASYLKMEEDKLKQLQIARENAARREIAINAAIQASQILVGITGAIAKIATPGIGIAETIASIAVIVSSLAAGFALVKSLQDNQPRFATGEKYVRRKRGEPPGIDTIPARLTEGEAVITKEKNKAYHPVIEAIHDGTVPPDFLNQQVERYHQVKQSPQINYERVHEATQMHVMSDGKLAALVSEQNRKIDENNHLQRQTLEAMRRMSVNATIDKDGVSIAVNEWLQKMRIDKFT